MGMSMSIILRYFILSFAFPSSLPCILCNRNGDAKMSRQTEVHTLRRQCHIRKALSSRLENVLKSRLYMRYVFSIYSPPIQSFTFSQEVLLLRVLLPLLLCAILQLSFLAFNQFVTKRVLKKRIRFYWMTLKGSNERLWSLPCDK